MKHKSIYLGISMLALSTISAACFANEILLTASAPHEIVYKVAHQNINSETVYGEAQKTFLKTNLHISVKRHGFDYAGIVIVSVDGRMLPDNANQFAKPYQCSITTDKIHGAGAIEVTTQPHQLNCYTYGGIFS